MYHIIALKSIRAFLRNQVVGSCIFDWPSNCPDLSPKATIYKISNMLNKISYILYEISYNAYNVSNIDLQFRYLKSYIRYLIYDIRYLI